MKQGGRVWTALVWLRRGPSGGSTWNCSWSFWLYKIKGIYWLAEELLAFQERIWSLELDIDQVNCVLQTVKCTDSFREFTYFTYSIHRLKKKLAHKFLIVGILVKNTSCKRWTTRPETPSYWDIRRRQMGHSVKWPGDGQQVVKSPADRHARPPTEVVRIHLDIKTYFQDPNFG